MVLASSDQVGSTNVADLASWSGKRSGRSKRWKTGWDFRPRDPAGNRWNCIHGTKWAPNSKLQEEKRKTTQVQDGQTKKKLAVFFEIIWILLSIWMYFWSGIFWFRSKDGPGHQARSGPWRVELYGWVWRHPRPGGVLWGPWRAGQWAPETSRNNGWDLEKRWDILWYTYIIN